MSISPQLVGGRGVELPMHLKSKETAVLAAVVLILVALAVRAFWPDGLITLDFKDAPVAKVISSVERQGRVRIVTNLSPETPVTIRVKRVPLMEALETLAVRTECDLRAVCVGAAKSTEAEAAFAGLKSGKVPETFAVAWFPAIGMSFGSNVQDPRSLIVKFEPEEKNSLQSALKQIAQKSGVMTAVPREWNPSVAAPAATSAAAAIRNLLNSSGGNVVEGFFLFSRDRRQVGSPGGEGEPQSGGGGGGRGGRERMNPEWIAQRTEAMIAQLPPAEQPAAKADFDAMRKVWEEVRALPEDQRREKMADIFSRPEVQDRMAAREAARDARRSPEQREQRMKKYVERKKQMKGAQ